MDLSPGLTGLTLILLASVAFLAVNLYLHGRRNERDVQERWSFVLTPACVEAFAEMKEDLRVRLARADLRREVAMTLAGDARRRMLAEGIEAIAETSAGVRDFLAGISEYSRLVAAIEPLPPLRPGRFRLGRVRALATAQAVLHVLLVTVVERFRFRLFVVRTAIRVTVSLLLGLRGRDESPAMRAAWEDHRALSDEALESFRTFLVSAFAVRRFPAEGQA